MKSVKVIFTLAGVSLIGALICFLAVLFLPEKKATKVETTVEQEQVTEPQNDENAKYKEAAEAEIKRFQETYGVEISMSDMVKELKIREEFELTYGTTYELEEVFLAETTEGHTVGDPGDDEMDETIAKIQEYVKRFNVDEARYASMTVEEELEALELEYGPLDAVDSTNVSEEPAVQETENEQTATEGTTAEQPLTEENTPDSEVEEGTE